jgi:hypothetical protein
MIDDEELELDEFTLDEELVDVDDELELEEDDDAAAPLHAPARSSPCPHLKHRSSSVIT